MPRGDGTGPAGMGPMTGRAAGYCAGYSVPGHINSGGGLGYGGRGRGRGRRNRYYATGLPGWARPGYGWPAGGDVASLAIPQPGPATPGMTLGQELAGLKHQAEHLKDALDEVDKRIEQLEAEDQK